MWNGDDSRKRVPADPPSEPKASLDERRMAAWIGKSLVVQGKVISTEDLTIDGRVEGAMIGDGHEGVELARVKIHPTSEAQLKDLKKHSLAFTWHRA